MIPYSDEYVKAHEEFALKAWPEKRRRRVEKFIRWKFRGPEHGDVDGLLIAVDDGKVLGQVGIIPVKIKSSGKVYDANWVCDIMVLKESRKLGIAKKIFEEILKSDNVILGNNPSPGAEVVMHNAGFRQLKSGRSMILPLNSEHILNWVVPGKFKFAVPLMKKIVQPYFSLKKKKIEKINHDYKKCEWEDIADYINLRQEKTGYSYTVHDEDFLKWRATGLEGFSARMKAGKTQGKKYILYSLANPYMNICEWNCDSIEEARMMAAFAISEAFENKSELVHVIANNDNEEKWLSSIGFIRARNIEKIIHYSKDKVLEKEEKFYFTLYDTDLSL